MISLEPVDNSQVVLSGCQRMENQSAAWLFTEHEYSQGFSIITKSGATLPGKFDEDQRGGTLNGCLSALSQGGSTRVFSVRKSLARFLYLPYLSVGPRAGGLMGEGSNPLVQPLSILSACYLINESANQG